MKSQSLEETIYCSIRNNIPYVIMEGSGGVADIIAQVADLCSSRITIDLIKEKLSNLFSDTYDSFTETQIEEWKEKIQYIVSMDSLLTILQEEKVGDQGMDVAILQALLKASQNSYNGQENWYHQLQLAVLWNRPDIAETQIFTEDWTWKPSDLYDSLTLSLIEDKPSFVRLFLERGVNLSEYLTWNTLTYLYNKIDPSCSIHTKLERQATVEGSIDELKIKLHHVSRVLQELLGDLTEPLYPESWSKQEQNSAQVNIKMNGKGGAKNQCQDSRTLDHPVRDLLIWCIVQNRAELADIIWNLTQDSVAGALACTKILKALSKEEEDPETMEQMTALANLYEERAAGVFSECYRNNYERAERLLTHITPKWGKTTALELAQQSKSLIFMSQGGVQMFLTKTWWGKLSVDNGFIQILLCMFFVPLIYSGLISYRLKPYSCLWKLGAFFTSPIVKFYYNVVSYIGFLWLFAYVLMIDFQTYPTWRECLVYVWVFSIFNEELRQLLYNPENRGFVKKSVEYISEFWNQVDLMALGLFAVGLICRLVRTDTVYLGRVFLALDYMIFCIRVMHIFSVSKVLGPKIIIFHRMVKDIFFFLFLLAVWIVSYGVAKQAILTTNEVRLDWIFRNVVYEPYLTLFGHIPSDIDSLNFDPTKCSQDGTDSTMPKCVLNDGSNTLFPEWLTIILMCLYLLLANILLLNLLIAMISYTFEEVENHTDQVWKFHRFGLIKEYKKRPVAPPPFILLTHLYDLLKHVILRLSANGHKVQRRELDKEEESSLLSWESYMKDNYQQMNQQKDESSQENMVKGIANSVSEVLRLLKIEKGSEGHQLEGRFSMLEEQMDTFTRNLNWITSAITEKGFNNKPHVLVHSSSQDSQDEKTAGGSDVSRDKNCLHHVNYRVLQYPLSNVSRYTVPDELVPWELESPGYEPPLYNDVRKDRGTYDPNIEME